MVRCKSRNEPRVHARLGMLSDQQHTRQARSDAGLFALMITSGSEVMD